MDREALETYISENYGATGESFWAQYPTYRVFRHTGSGKWFALVLDIAPGKLAPNQTATAHAAVVKCGEPLLPGYLARPGFYPAHYMDKKSWVTMALDEVPDEDIAALLDMSYDFAARAVKTKRKTK